MRARILIFCDYYLPGYKTGGGMWMVANLVESFADEYDFYVVTRDHDGRSDRRPYANILSDDWNLVECARVFYFSHGSLSTRRVVELVTTVRPDAVYLNSVFSLPVRQFLRTRNRGNFRHLPVILAPCGELSKRAISNKPIKKKLFVAAAKAAGLYRDLIWKASSNHEAADIARVIHLDCRIFVAPDLAPRSLLADYSETSKPEKAVGACRISYLSRIVPNKNLKYLLQCLSGIREGNIDLEIIGPHEDLQYWAECKHLISELSANITVRELGPLPNHEALKRVAASHFFALPTQNENFGYVFLEALAMGCPLVISDGTPWNDIEDHGAGWCVPLSDPARYTECLKQCVAMSPQRYGDMTTNARRYAEDWILRNDTVAANARVLDAALAQSLTPHVAAV
jgi:glycosyltransferase involved in cell wall biosynthesis